MAPTASSLTLGWSEPLMGCFTEQRPEYSPAPQEQYSASHRLECSPQCTFSRTPTALSQPGSSRPPTGCFTEQPCMAVRTILAQSTPCPLAARSQPCTVSGVAMAASQTP